jgi:hypothetical protein
VAPVPASPTLTTITPDTGLYNNDQITTGQNLTLSGLAAAGATTPLSRAGVGVPGSITANGSGVWTCDYSGTTLAERTYDFTAAIGRSSPATRSKTAPSFRRR